METLNVKVETGGIRAELSGCFPAVGGLPRAGRNNLFYLVVAS